MRIGIRVLYVKNGQREALAYGGGETERGRVTDDLASAFGS